MNQKRTFGTILTILGIIALIYAAVEFAQHSEAIRSQIVFLVLGIIFFFTGISLIRTTKDIEK